MRYNHNLIEARWQAYWEQHQTYQFVDDPTKKKFYCLDMFPYPSGSGLHVGHLKGYLATEILARYHKMLGEVVLHPIGWDAFGLPAEQYALKTQNHPAVFTNQNINYFRTQLKKIGFSFDYAKEVNTTDPNYYKITQWIFLQLFHHNLAHLQTVNVNWCPELKSVLANEEVVVVDGKRVSERGHHLVISKPMKQWVLKITNYAEELLSDLALVNWPEGIKNHQKKWIGKKVVYQFACSYQSCHFSVDLVQPEDIFHLKQIVINAHHELITYLKSLAQFDQVITNYLNDHLNQKDLVLHVQVVNPVTKALIPVHLTKKLTNPFSELIPVIGTCECTNHQPLDWSSYQQVTKYQLRDWIFSRQRYWGEPIPIYFDENNQPHMETNLPLTLPLLAQFQPGSEGHSPLIHAHEWLNVEINGKKYVRESHTMPNWAGSCWYYLAYILKQADGSYLDINSPAAQALITRWLPVDVYIGGQEHAVLHLLYARFWHKFLYDLNLVPTKEPFMQLVNQGMILGPDGSKMSKSKGNVINPDEIVNSHGADALRVYECFMGPVSASLAWNEHNLNAIRKWLDRVYGLFMNLSSWTLVTDQNQQMKYLGAKLIQEFEVNVQKFSFNNVISALMVCVNELQKHQQYSKRLLKTFVKVLSLFAPHLAEELWFHCLEQTTSVYFATWDHYEPSDLALSTYQLPIMINHKVKVVLTFANELTPEQITEVVNNHPVIISALNNQVVTKVVHVPKKIYSILTK